MRRKDKISLAVLSLAFAALVYGMAHAANNPALSGITQGWIIGNASSTVLTPLQGGSIRKQLLIQYDPAAPIGSYLCVAFGSPSQSQNCVATCTTAGGDFGGIKISPGGSMEWPRDPGGPTTVPQGDVCAACTSTGCNMTVFQQ
jgi:hypothetical protein